MPVPKIDTPTSRMLLREQVRDKIRDAILDGTLRPGERLHDDDLVGWLGVSRTPIREALGTLAHEGLIEMTPNRFTRVTQLEAGDVLDVACTLGVIMGGVVRVTVPVLTAPEQRDVIRRVDRRIERLRAGGSTRIDAYAEDDYLTWLALCPNPTLVTVGRQVVHGLAFKLRADGTGRHPYAGQLIEHLTMFRDAVAAGSPIDAEIAIEAAHMLGSHETDRHAV